VALFSVLPRAFRPRLSSLQRGIVAVFEGFAIVASLTPRIAQPQTPRLALCCSLIGQGEDRLRCVSRANRPSRISIFDMMACSFIW
jgi:hypothetical protein